MTKSYVVTGTGCRRREESFVIPEGVQVIFYRTRPNPPRLDTVRTPIDELMVAMKLLSATAAGPGETVRAAFCWQRFGEGPPSGVYRRSTGLQVMDLKNTSPRQPVALGHIVRELASNRGGRLTVVHWLVQPADPAPLRRNWRLQQPQRLFNNDDAESAHAPLTDLSGRPIGDGAPADDAVPPGWVTVSHRP